MADDDAPDDAQEDAPPPAWIKVAVFDAAGNCCGVMENREDLIAAHAAADPAFRTLPWDDAWPRPAGLGSPYAAVPPIAPLP